MAKTAADILIERLIAWGVDTIFGLPGDGINGLFESLRTHQDRIRFIQVRHEEAAAFAACGYAKYTGRLGACLATSGPGGIHLLNGLYDAKMDGQPVLAITGHTFHDLIGTRYQQDVDLERVYLDVAVYTNRITGPSHVRNVVDEAVRQALARRGVACLVIPKDVQEETTDEDERSPANVPGHSADVFRFPRPLPSPPELQRAADLLNGGEKVAILAGQGALGAGAELEQVAELLAAPIIKPLLGKACVPDDSPYTTGGIGLLGTRPSQEALEECDALLIAGSSFPYMEYYPKPGQARAVQIDIDSSRIGLRYPVESPLPGDTRDVLSALMPLLRRRSDRRFLVKAQEGMHDWWKLIEERGTRDDVPMKPQVVAYQLNKLLRDDAIVTADSGTIATWAARYIRIRRGMQFSLSGNLATMANGFPYSIAAQVAHPDRQVVALVGDGGFTMLMGEIATCVKYQLPVKIVIFKNNVLGQIKWEQMVFEGNPEFGVELQPIDFARVAEACGAAGFSVDNPRDLPAVLDQALSHPGPAFVEAVVDPNEPPMPPKVTLEQAKHFAESLIHGQPNRARIALTVISDKVREVV
ncbi:MAG: thiamine pyrophosphate-binding protein [Dehalococcoidia bacterium]